MSLVRVEAPRPHVRVLTLNNPKRLNAMSFALVEALYAALAQVAADNDAWVAVLTGTGRGFCSGLDLEDNAPPPGSEGMGLPRLAMRAMTFMAGVVPAMRGIPQPIIAAVNGPAYGGGMCLTLGADVRIAADSAVFSAAAITNGLTGSELGATYLLPRAVGTSNAAEILLTGRKVGAEEALRIGLVSRVVPDGEVLDSALQMADQMCELSPFGIQMTKAVLWSNLEASSLTAALDLENRNQLLAGYTGNLDEAKTAFREKRKPVYRD
ncbi:MAG: enoyl-CoA hydratase-related protein [Candidatus Binatia bacterium]